MAGAADRFWAELKALHEAAGRPTLESLGNLRGAKRPGRATIDNWLSGRTVPGGDNQAYFLMMVAELEDRAAKAGTYGARPQGSWSLLLKAARAERDEARGGRPRGARPPAESAGPVMLPAGPRDLVGRRKPLEGVLAWLRPDQTVDASPQPGAVVVSAVAGMGGVGKTALALHAAHQACRRGWFPGGVLFADLRGYSTDPEVGPAAVADRFLRALGVKAKDLPAGAQEKLDAWRILVNDLAGRGRPLLVVLDNARTADQVAPLLPPSPHRALVTSRQTLSALPDVRRVTLDALEPCHALDLLERALRADRADDDRVSTQHEDAQRLAALCGHLPLALRIIAALLRDTPTRSLADQVKDLEDVRTRLDALAYDDNDSEGRPLAIRATFELSYRHLTADQARAFRLLAAAPGPDISTSAATALLDHPHSPRLLAALTRAHLLHADPDRPDRWSMHDLVRLFADDHGRTHADTDQRTAAQVRLLDHYTALAAAADTHLEARGNQLASDRFGGRSQALAWLDAEHLNLVSAASFARTLGHTAATDLVFALARFFERRRHIDDWIALATAAAEIYAQAEDYPNQAAVLVTLGHAYVKARRFEEAIEALPFAAAVFQVIGDRRSQAVALTPYGLALWESRRFDEAITALSTAVRFYEEVGDHHGRAGTLTDLGLVLAQVGRFGEAITAHVQAVVVHRETGDDHGRAAALTNLGAALIPVRRFDEAITALSTAADTYRNGGDQHGEAAALANLGAAFWRVQRFDDAIRTLRDSARIHHDADNPHGRAGALTDLGAVLAQVGRLEQSISELRTAVTIYQQLGDRNREARVLANLGGALTKAGRHDEAFTALTASAAGTRQTDDRHGEAVAWNNLGDLHTETKRFQEAITAYNCAVAAYRDSGDRHGEADAQNNLGRALQKAKLLQEAIDACTAAADGTGDGHGEGDS